MHKKLIMCEENRSIPLRAVKVGSVFKYDGLIYTKISDDLYGNSVCLNMLTNDNVTLLESHNIIVTLLSYPDDEEDPANPVSEEIKVLTIQPLVTTDFMKVFILQDAIVLLTREDLGDLYGIRVRFAYKDLDIKISSEYQTEEQQFAIFDNFTHNSAAGMLEELKFQLEAEKAIKEDPKPFTKEDFEEIKTKIDQW